MAYTPAPELQTYSTQKIPLATDFKLRPGNNMNFPIATQWGQDAGMVNALPIKVEGTEVMSSVTRPGLSGRVLPAATGVVRGTYVWEKGGSTYYFLVVGQGVFTSATSPLEGGTWVQLDTLITNATTPVRFTEFIDATNVKKLILVDGVEGYVYTTNAGGTKITDADFPTPHIPWPVFLNGRLYLAKANTGDIYNSNLNDPALWTAGDFISTEVYPDDVQALVKVANYILAIGTQGSEYFYDDANAVGSPLARQEGAVLPFGTQFPNSVAVNKDVVVLFANSNEGRSSFKAIEELKYKDIEAPSIVSAYSGRLLNPYNDFAVSSASCRGTLFRHDGLLYYGLLTDGVRGGLYQVPSVAATFVYSFSAKAWTELQYGSATDSRENRWAFPLAFTGNGTTSGALFLYCAGNIGVSGLPFFGKLDASLATDTVVGVSSDAAVNIYEEWRTENLTFDTMNIKTGLRFGLDVELNNQGNDNVSFGVQWNDSDYNYTTWTTARTLTVHGLTSGVYFPFITQLGSFRRRAFRIYHASGQTIRTRGIEFDINKGQQ